MEQFPEFPAYDEALMKQDISCSLTINVTEAQYKNWEMLANTFISQNNLAGYELLLGMIEDLKSKKYDNYNAKARQLESMLF
jgi:hypothetical protein